jgi:thioredoxin 1
MKNKKLNIVLIIIVVSVSLLLLLGKDKLNCAITNYKLRNSDIEINQTDSAKFLAQFHNTDKSKDFELSLIEFGGYGCKPCMKMDTVLADLGKKYGEKLNIKIIRVTEKEGRKTAKYFSVNEIPTQIIIDRNGIEIFRHTGFLSKDELIKLINMHIDV